MIKFACPGCGKTIKTPDSAAGTTGKCPGCGSSVTVPDETPIPPGLPPFEPVSVTSIPASTQPAEPVASSRASRFLARFPWLRTRPGIITASIVAVLLIFGGGFWSGREYTLREIAAVFRDAQKEYRKSIATLFPGFAKAAAADDDTAVDPIEVARVMAKMPLLNPSESAPDAPKPREIDPDKAVAFGDVRLQIEKCRIGKCLETSMFSREPTQSKNAFLSIGLYIENGSETKKFTYRSPTTRFGPRLLKDNFGNDYKSHGGIGGDGFAGQDNYEELPPGKSVHDLLVFDVPVEKASHVELTIPAENFGGKGELLIRIPLSKFERVDQAPASASGK